MQLNDKYQPLYTGNTRYFVLTGGRGSGKSFATNLFLTHLTFQENQRILFTRYTMTSARVSILPEFQEKIELLKAEQYFDIQLNEIINKKNNSAVLFRGIKTSSGIQTAALKSLQGITTWVVDEAEELPDENEFDKIDLSIRQKGVQNRVILILNPTTTNHWIYRRFFEERGISGGYNGTHTDTTYIHTTYEDNITNLDESFLNQVERIKESNINKYNHVILGGWINTAEGVIFESWKEGTFDTSLPYCYGQDYGFSVDPTTLVKVAINKKEKKIYVHEVWFSKGKKLGTEDIARANKNLIEKQNDMIVADAHGQQLRILQDLSEYGLNMRPCLNESVAVGIIDMLDYELIITPESVNVKKELSNYVWNDKKAGVPIDNYNHTIDSIRYAFRRLKGGQVVFA